MAAARFLLALFLAAVALPASHAARLVLTSSLPAVVRLKGGSPASAGFNVLLTSAKSEKKFCSASLIEPRWVLFAGHCVKDLRRGDIATLADTSFPPFSLERVFRHPDHDFTSNDIALARLNSPAFPRGDLLPLSRFPPPDGAVVTEYGYGATGENGASWRKLRKIDMEVVGGSRCRDMFRRAGKLRAARVVDDEMHICANDKRGGGQCRGDSGGPLVYKGRQVGVASFRVGACGISNRPDVFTRVATYVDWIEGIVGHPVAEPKTQQAPGEQQQAAGGKKQEGGSPQEEEEEDSMH